MLSFRRFVARRNLPKVLISDNAKTFKKAEKQMVKMYGSDAPQWRFIVARAPWWGGWWERMVRSVKLALKKCIGARLITREELTTLLSEIENIVNSRPLTQVSDGIDDQRPITPNDFLTGRNSYPEDSSLQIKYGVKVKALSKFWKIWSTDYLRNLPKLVPQFKDQGTLIIGSLVPVQDENLPKVEWPVGRVLETYPGPDGLIRSVKVKTARKTIT